MNMVFSDYKGVTVPAVHRQRVIAGLEDFTVFKCDVVATNKPDSGAASLQPDSSNGQIGTIDELDIIMPIDVVGWTSKQR